MEYQDRHWNIDRREEGTWNGRRRDGGAKSTLRIKEQEKRLTLNEHDDDDDDDDSDGISHSIFFYNAELDFLRHNEGCLVSQSVKI